MQASEQRVALITGAARRVGRAIALKLADAGFDVAFTYLSSAPDAQSLLEELRAKGRSALAIRADLTDPVAAVQTIGAQFLQSFDRLDVLVNNASLYEAGGLNDADVAQMRRLWAIHVESPLLLCRTFYPHLKGSRGHVVNMVDLLAQRPAPPYLAYAASKAGLWNLTLGLAAEMAPEVTVNGIAPGVVEWPADFPEQAKAEYLRRVPLGRAGTPQDVAAAVLFFCTAATYVTGQILRLDGGRSIA